MAQVQRNEPEFGEGRPQHRPAADVGYGAGGQIADMQADIARRLASRQADMDAEAPIDRVERIVRLLSSTAGYAALLAGYGLVTVALVRWLS